MEKQIEARGVLDPKILPYYPYRDDAVPLYKIIRKYVTNVVKYFYGTSGNICDRCFFYLNNFCRHPGETGRGL